MAVQQLKIKSIYDHYELYSALYSREPAWKAAESAAFSFCMAHLASYSKKKLLQGRPAIDFESVGFNVVEAFSGRGEHRDGIILPPELKINCYKHLDIRDHSGTAKDFIQGDITTVALPPELDINFIIAGFYSISSIHDEEGKHTRKLLLDWFTNCFKNLRAGGAMLIDFAPDGYNQSLYQDSDESNKNMTVELYPVHPLRTALGIPYNVTCEVEYSQSSFYDRMTCTNYDEFEGPVTIKAGSRVVAQIRIEQPMSQRYFGEAELVDIAKEAGFSDILFFCNDYSDSEFDLLDHKLLVDDGIDDTNIGGWQSNCMVLVA